MTLYHKSGWHEALELAALVSSSSSTLVFLAELMTEAVASRGLKLASLLLKSSILTRTFFCLGDRKIGRIFPSYGIIKVYSKSSSGSLKFYEIDTMIIFSGKIFEYIYFSYFLSIL